MGKFGPKKSQWFVSPETWHTEYLEDVSSYSDISFWNSKPKSRGSLIFILTLVFWNSWPKSIFWKNLSQKIWTVCLVWKLIHILSQGCDWRDTEEGLKAKAKMNNGVKCLLLLYFVAAKGKNWSNQWRNVESMRFQLQLKSSISKKFDFNQTLKSLSDYWI